MLAGQAALARQTAARIGRVGVWTSLLSDLAAAQSREVIRAVEALGFRVVWLPESAASKEIFSHSALLLGASEHLIVAPGIANIWARDPVAMANGARTLGDAYPGRFLLGMGVSHAPTVSARGGGQYRQPLEHMREYLDLMAAAPFQAPQPIEPVPLVLAALGPKMLRLAAERTAGAHPYFVPVEHTRQARQTLGAGPLLAVEQAAVLEADPARARAIARRHTTRYLSLANYANNLRRLGWSEPDLANGGSDRFVDALVAWGDLEQVAARIQAHLDAGADHVCVQALTADPDAAGVLSQLERLASTDLARTRPASTTTGASR